MAINPTLIRTEGSKAQAMLRFAGVVKDAETITVGPYVFEYCARDTAHVTAGNIRMNIAEGGVSTAVKAQGKLTLPTIPTANDTMLIGTKTFTFVALGTATTNGQIDIGLNVAATKLAIVKAIKGTDTLNVAHTQVDCAAAFVGNDLIITALVAGTAGNAIPTTQAITPADGVFDAATLGTTTAGVDATAEDGVDAFIAAFPAGAGVLVRATKLSASEVLIEAVNEGAFGYATTETLATGSNEFSATKMFGGKASGTNIKFALLTRVPNAVEDLADLMVFPIDFLPKYAQALVYTTSTGLQVLWNGKLDLGTTAPKYFVSLDNSGNVDWSVNETVSLLILG